MNERKEMLSGHHRSLWHILILTLILGAFVIHYHATHTSTYTIDSYFYLSKAKQLAAGNGLHTTWNTGVDTKYFPGYSIFLSAFRLVKLPFIVLQLLSYFVCAMLILAITKELEFEPIERLLAATVFAANPIVIKWLSLPMAEGVTLALSLFSLFLFLKFVKARNNLLLFSACMVGGVAVIARIEALFLLAVFGSAMIPHRKSVSWTALGAGLLLFLMPVAVYWIQLRVTVAQNPSYVSEFRSMLSRTDILGNAIYNILVPLGFMYRPWGPTAIIDMEPAAAVAGAIWASLGLLVFVGGLIFCVLGRFGQKSRVAGILFLIYAVGHSLWYYGYERFMLMAIPLAAIVWASAIRSAFSFLASRKPSLWWALIMAQALIAGSGLYWGNHYTYNHRIALEVDTGGLEFEEIAKTINDLNAERRSGVLTDLGPHLAYYIESHSYLSHGRWQYWRRAFALEKTFEEISRLGIGFVVTMKSFEDWLEVSKISPDAMERFREVSSPYEGVTIIECSPHVLPVLD